MSFLTLRTNFISLLNRNFNPFCILYFSNGFFKRLIKISHHRFPILSALCYSIQFIFHSSSKWNIINC